MGDVFYKALVAGAVAAILGLVEIVYKKAQTPRETHIARRGGFLKTYYTKETPIKFHKFNHYFFLPVRFFVLAISISDFIVNFQSYDTLGIFSVLAFTVLPCILIVVTFVGFFKWTTYSFCALFAYFVLDVISGVYVLTSYLRYFPEEHASAIGRFCGTAVVAILICIYYWNRRNLFLHKLEPPVASGISTYENSLDRTNIAIQTPSTQKEETFEPEIVESNDSVKYCRKCGKKLLPESAFCSYCGTKVIWEE